MKSNLFKVLILIGVVCLSCNREETRWEEAKTANSPKMYELFIQDFPESSLLDSASVLLNKLFINEISGRLIKSDSSAVESQQVFLYFLENDSVYLEFKDSLPINPGAITDTNGNYLIEFNQKRFRDIDTFVLGINYLGPRILEKEGMPLRLDLDSVGKRIDFGNYTYNFPKQEINYEFTPDWNPDSTKSYNVSLLGNNIPFRGASCVDISPHFFVSLDKGVIYSDLTNSLIDAESEQLIKAPRLSF